MKAKRIRQNYGKAPRAAFKTGNGHNSNAAYFAHIPLKPGSLQHRLKYGDLKGAQTSGGIKNAKWNSSTQEA